MICDDCGKGTCTITNCYCRRVVCATCWRVTHYAHWHGYPNLALGEHKREEASDASLSPH